MVFGAAQDKAGFYLFSLTNGRAVRRKNMQN